MNQPTPGHAGPPKEGGTVLEVSFIAQSVFWCPELGWKSAADLHVLEAERDFFLEDIVALTIKARHLPL